LEKAGINPDRVLGGQQTGNDTERVGYCPIPLPTPKKMLPDDTPVAKRLFIVCQPSFFFILILKFSPDYMQIKSSSTWQQVNFYQISHSTKRIS
jgi:hypothetical protein